jgi:hypothetical protein
MICVDIYIVRSIHKQAMEVTPGLLPIRQEPDCEVFPASGWQTLDLDVGIVLETCLGELHAAFGIGASCSFYSQLGSCPSFEKALT